MSLENNVEQLEKVRVLCDNGQWELAADEVERLLKEGETHDARHLQTRILIHLAEKGDWRRSTSLREALDFLKNYDSDQCLHALKLLETPLREVVERYYVQVETPDHDLPLAALEKLLVLAPHFPILHLLRTATEAVIAQRLKSDRNTRSKLRRTLDILGIERSNSGDKGILNTSGNYPDAARNLEQAYGSLPENETLRAFAARTLAELHLAFENLVEAFTWYKNAESLGLEVGEAITPLIPRLSTFLRAQAHEEIDQLLVQGDFEAASERVELLNTLDPSPAALVRLADVAFVQNLMEVAERGYRATLDCLHETVPGAALSVEAIRILSQGWIKKRDNQLHQEDATSETQTHDEDLEEDQTQELNLTREAQNAPLHPSAVTLASYPGARYQIPPQDIQCRALAGMLTIHQQRGETDAAHAIFLTLLGQAGLPAVVQESVLKAFEQNEQLIYHEQIDSLRSQAQAAVQAGDWQGAVKHFYALSCLPGAAVTDMAWLSVATNHNGGTVGEVVHLLQSISPETLATLPTSFTRPLVDGLADAGRWMVSDRYISLMSGDPAWQSHYQEQRTAEVRRLINMAQEAVECGAAAEAEMAARRALELSPQAAQAQLVLGRVYAATARLSQARNLVEPLIHNPELSGAAVLALAEVDLASGRLEDARERLRLVSEADTSPALRVLREAVENRVTSTPAIQVEALESRVAVDTLRRTPAEGWAAYFAVRITSARANRGLLPIRERCAELMMALSNFSAHTGAGIETDIAWRYLGSGGKLTAALICRVEAASESATRDAARTLWQMLKPLLPLNGVAFAFEPVFSVGELDHLRNPLRIESAVEIARKEIVVQTGDHPEDEVYLVYPLGIHDDSLLRMLNALSEQPRPTLLDIHLKPAEVLQWERRAITQMVQKQGQAELLKMLPELEELPTPNGTLDSRAQLIQQFYPMALDRMQSLAFVVQIHIGAQGQLDAALPTMVSMGLFGTSRYEIIRALMEHEVQIIRRNVREVTCERWAYSATPPGLERWRYMLTPDEALTASRLPHPGAGGVPGLPVLKIRASSPPDRLSRTGVVVGESLLSEGGRPSLVRLGLHDRTRHAYVVGRTGSGKSTLLLNMALQDIEAGRGVGVIDPHGDLIRFLLERIPPHRLHDVVVFDPADTERPVAFNIMDVEDMFEGNMVIADFLGLMRRMFDPHDQGIVGPRFENIIRNTMLALMEVKPGSTLIDVVRFLSDKEYREQIVKFVTDPVVLNYWNNIGKELDKFGWGSAKGEVLDWLTSKFGRFVDDKMVRNIIGQSRSTINFRDIMDSGKIMLVDLSKGRVGYQISQFLGLLLVPRLLVAALGRARQQSENRRPFYLYVDEFQSFVTPAFSEMLSEARKFNVSMVVANQFISQLTDEIRESVFGNVGNFFVFQVGIKDSAYLTPELYPAEMEDLVNLPNYHMLAKILVDGSTVPPFPVRTLPDSHTPNLELAAKIRDYSRKRYGRDAFLVNQEIQKRFAPLPGQEEKKPERKGLFDL